MTAQKFMDELFAKLEHGDQEHRAWLKAKMQEEVKKLQEVIDSECSRAAFRATDSMLWGG